MRKVFVLGVAAVTAFAVVGAAGADSPPPTTFVTPMDTFQEVPACVAGDNSTRGLAIFHVVDQATGTVAYKLIANNLPGTPRAAHIHLAPRGTAGGIVQPLMLMAGEENGVIADATFTSPAIVAALQTNGNAYYVNVHTEVCPGGALRGQLGEHGPPGTAE
ncbi:MAG TPA: CHRD domain-containing protein [Gaiellaceae bacterium]|jgi:hypothetical protein|nr:CHRD domain-containing protein [Gaiellaceae bacterium]